MARPRNTDITDSALYKIDAAFWRLLEKMDYSFMTMKLLAEEAGVNRNTLYYHDVICKGRIYPSITS